MPESYGVAGAWLAEHRLRRPGAYDGAIEAPTTAPTPTVAPRADPPGERSGEWRADALEVEVVVGGGDSPGKVVSVLSTLREWRFEPAWSAGEPVPVLYQIDGD